MGDEQGKKLSMQNNIYFVYCISSPGLCDFEERISSVCCALNFIFFFIQIPSSTYAIYTMKWLIQNKKW